MTGTIKKMVGDKAYGFILGSDNKEYFFHMSTIQKCAWEDLAEGDAVTFNVSQGPKGPRAEGVTPQ